MKNMTFENIAHAVSGQLFLSEKDNNKTIEISSVVTDNRQIEKDGLFVPIKGQKVDGHKFIPAAFEAGAALVLSENEIENPTGSYILVANTEQALKDVAAYYRMQLTIPIIGIVGSVGKTSTKEMVANVLSQKYHVLKTEGNFNNEIGLPLTVCKIRDDHEVAVVEMGISDFEEMHRLGAVAQPDYVVMTNIGLCHLENLGTRDGILKAKTEVFEHFHNKGCAILNGDDDKLSTITDACGAEIVFYGCSGQQVSADDVENLGLEGMRSRFILSNGEVFTATIPIPGSHNVSNALAAAAVGEKLGLTAAQIKAGIETAATISGRTNFVEHNGITVIDDCYNANPVSMKASIEVLSHAKGRTIAVLGDMGELGEHEKELHYQVGEAIVENEIDELYTAGTLAKEIARAVTDTNSDCKVRTFDTRDELIETLLPDLVPGDTVLVKASHFMAFPEVVARILAK